MKPFEILVIGGSGFIGGRLIQAAINAGHHTAYTYATHKLSLPAPAYPVNIEDLGTLEDCIIETHPKNIIYCAVPHPRSHKEIHWLVSVDGIKRILSMLDRIETPRLIYVSTNSVFSGKNEFNRECDIPDPEACLEPYKTYAITRYEGENVALSQWNNAIVVRTSNVDGWNAEGVLSSRLASLVKKLVSNECIERFKNRLISPTLVDNLVEAMLEITNEYFSYRGVMHIAGNQIISDYEYTRLLARHLNVNERFVKPSSMQSSTISGMRNISLDTRNTQSLLKTRLLDVNEQLSALFSSRIHR